MSHAELLQCGFGRDEQMMGGTNCGNGWHQLRHPWSLIVPHRDSNPNLIPR